MAYSEMKRQTARNISDESEQMAMAENPQFLIVQ